MSSRFHPWDRIPQTADREDPTLGRYGLPYPVTGLTVFQKRYKRLHIEAMRTGLGPLFCKIDRTKLTEVDDM